MGNVSTIVDVSTHRSNSSTLVNTLVLMTPLPTSAMIAGDTIPAGGACCSTVTSDGISEAQADQLAELFRALADPARIRVLSLVANASDGELCACDLTAPLGRSQPTVSHHLAILVDAGLLTREKRGRWAWYRLVPERLNQIRSLLATAEPT
jgi:ArsR family transcriptional regulator, arsenate/arsenite/antimonite-responsive transcriptional repressor